MNFFINFYKYDNFLIANKFLYMNYDYESISASDGRCEADNVTTFMCRMSWNLGA